MSTKELKENLQPSVIRRLFEYAKERKLEIGEENVFDFSIGNPSVPTPKIVKDALIELLNGDSLDVHGYTANSGDVTAKKAISDFLLNKFGAEIPPKLIYITCGASPALVFTIHALVKPNEEVIVFAPYFPEYGHYVSYVKGRLVVVNYDQKFIPLMDDFKKKISPLTRLVIINSPNNPSGVFYSAEVIKQICDILKEKEEEYGHPIYLLSDEPYREILYNGQEYPFVTNYYDDSLIGYSFSKSLSLPGERIGYLAVNSRAKDAEGVYRKITSTAHNLGYICAPSLFQHLIPKVIGEVCDVHIYENNRDLLYKNLTDIGFDVFNPGGAFYMFIKAPNGNSLEFAKRAKEFEIIMVPADEFSAPGYVRLAYCVDKKIIENSKEAFKKLFESYRG